MKRVLINGVIRCALLIGISVLTFSTTVSAEGNWTSTNYWNQGSQMQIVQVTSMVTHKLTCTVTWRGTYIGPQVPGAPKGDTGGTFTMVLPPYPGFGAAIVGRQGAKYITNFSYQIVCS